MDTIALHETLIRLAKGIVSTRERHGCQAAVGGAIVQVLDGSPFAGVLAQPTSDLKASIGMWEHRLTLERSKAR
jgi:hypothetical protein